MKKWLAFISIMVLTGFGAANAALVNFTSDTVDWSLNTSTTYLTTLLELGQEFQYAEGATLVEIWVKQAKVNGNTLGEVVSYKGSENQWHELDTMDPGNNGWQTFQIQNNLISFFDLLHDGLQLRFANGENNEMATPVSASFRLFNTSQVPIPSAAWLLGAGLIGLVAIRRRGNRSGQE